MSRPRSEAPARRVDDRARSGVPRFMVVPAVLGLAFLVVPLVALFVRAPWRTLPDHFFVAECGIGVAKGNDSLRTAVDELLRRWHADGTIAALWEKWYGAPMAVPVTL